jgi:hypothetical protein
LTIIWSRQMHSWQFHITNVLIALFLAGCATSVSTNIKPTSANVAKYNELSALDVVTTLEKNVNEAKSANMPFLAPNYFREAVQILNECQSALSSKPKEVVVNNAAKGDAILEKGRSVMGIVKYRFAKELVLKDQLDAHLAPTLVPNEYESAIGELSRLIEKVEREQPDNIDKEKDTLIQKMSDLVIKAVQVGALHESETINEESKNNNAERLAPLTYSEALRVYQDSKSGIAAAYYDQALVKRLGEAALFAARHARHINDRVALLHSQLKISAAGNTSAGRAISSSGTQVGTQTEGKSPDTEKITVEKIVLQEEDRLRNISSALGLKDLRDLPLEKQTEEIRRAAADAASQPNSEAARQDFEARLGAADKKIQQAVADLAQKDKLLTEKDKQLAEKTRQLAEKDKQLKTMKSKLSSMKLL